jgi:MFS family permease
MRGVVLLKHIDTGNAGVSRTSVGEYAQNNGVDKGRAFGIFGFCTALGTLVGPLIGGYLSMVRLRCLFCKCFC